jgi:hypothetical protein
MNKDVSGTTYAQTDNARQGVTGHNVRYVLAWGIFGIIVAFAAVVMVV